MIQSLLNALTEDSNIALTVAIIGACTLLAAALIGLIGVLLSGRRDIRTIREQVVNDHSTNMRVENDDRHDQNSRRLNVIDTRQQQVVKALTRIEDHLGIEHTIPRLPRRKK